jgi:hypothetical protein
VPARTVREQSWRSGAFSCSITSSLPLRGIPLIYMGDELGLLNDYGYADDPVHADDNRWLHRPQMDWEEAAAPPRLAERDRGGYSRESSGWQRRAKCRARFMPRHGSFAVWTHNERVFGLLRASPRGRILVLANFSERPQAVPRHRLHEMGLTGVLANRLDDRTWAEGAGLLLEAYEVLWLQQVATPIRSVSRNSGKARAAVRGTTVGIMATVSRRHRSRRDEICLCGRHRAGRPPGRRCASRPPRRKRRSGRRLTFFRSQRERHRGVGAIGIAAFGPLDPNPASPTYGMITSTPKPGWAHTDFAGAVQRRSTCTRRLRHRRERRRPGRRALGRGAGVGYLSLPDDWHRHRRRGDGGRAAPARV